jgi:hypothetical protein
MYAVSTKRAHYIYRCLVYFTLLGLMLTSPAQAGRFTVLGTGAIDDIITGLKWQQFSPDNEMTKEAAIAYCTELEGGGLIPWRLPSREALQSLVDKASTNGFPSGFEGRQTVYFDNAGLFVAMAKGPRLSAYRTTAGVRCVKGALKESYRWWLTVRAKHRQIFTGYWDEKSSVKAPYTGFSKTSNKVIKDGNTGVVIEYRKMVNGDYRITSRINKVSFHYVDENAHSRRLSVSFVIELHKKKPGRSYTESLTEARVCVDNHCINLDDDRSTNADDVYSRQVIEPFAFQITKARDRNYGSFLEPHIHIHRTDLDR